MSAIGPSDRNFSTTGTPATVTSATTAKTTAPTVKPDRNDLLHDEGALLRYLAGDI